MRHFVRILGIVDAKTWQGDEFPRQPMALIMMREILLGPVTPWYSTDKHRSIILAVAALDLLHVSVSSEGTNGAIT